MDPWILVLEVTLTPQNLQNYYSTEQLVASVFAWQQIKEEDKRSLQYLP